MPPNESIGFGNINEINFNESIKIYWGEEAVGYLSQGPNIYLHLMQKLLSNEYISSENKLLIAAKLQKWIEELVKTVLWPVKETENENISPNVRAIHI